MEDVARKKYNITFLGDSITEGYFGMPPFYKLIDEQQYTGYVQNLGIACSTIGIPESYKYGDTATHPFVERYNEIDELADVIFVLGGTNDYGNTLNNNVPLGEPDDISTDTFYGALKMLISGIKEARASAVLVMCTPIRRYNGYTNWPQSDKNNFGYTLEDYCEAIKNVSVSMNVRLLDLYNVIPEFITEDKDEFMKYFEDGIHPNSEGHRLLAGVFGDCICEIFNVTTR